MTKTRLPCIYIYRYWEEKPNRSMLIFGLLELWITKWFLDFVPLSQARSLLSMKLTFLLVLLFSYLFDADQISNSLVEDLFQDKLGWQRNATSPQRGQVWLIQIDKIDVETEKIIPSQVSRDIKVNACPKFLMREWLHFVQTYFNWSLFNKNNIKL